MHPCRRMKMIVLMFFLLLSTAMRSQPNANLNSGSVDFSSFKQKIRNDSVLSFKSPKGFFPSLIHNLGRQAVFPFHMKGNDFILAGGTIAATGTLIYYDESIDKTFRPIKDNNRLIKEFSPHFTELGDYYGYILLAGYGGYTIAAHKYRGFRTSLLATQAAISAGLWIRLGKMLTGRMRPGETYNDPEYNSDHWFGPFGQFKTKYNSKRGIGGFDAFPSGHTGAAFAIATVFAKQYKDLKAVPVTAYSLAGLVGISRLVEHHHWASDVLLGGVIGYLCGKQVVDNENRLFPDYKIAERKFKTYFFPTSQNGINCIGWLMVF